MGHPGVRTRLWNRPTQAKRGLEWATRGPLLAEGGIQRQCRRKSLYPVAQRCILTCVRFPDRTHARYSMKRGFT